MNFVSDKAIAVVGAYHTPLGRQVYDQSLEEMVFQAARGALADANLTIEDIDAVILSTTDQVEGRVIESMVTNGAAGGVDRDVTTLASAGEHAFIYGYLRLLAGQGRRVLAVVWSKESESLDPAHADILGAEPFLLRPLGMTSSAAAGLQASAYAARYGLDTDAVRTVRTTRSRAAERAHGLLAEDEAVSPLVAWPLTGADLPRSCDVATAVVMVLGEEVTSGQSPAWVKGVGWSMDRYDLGERDLSQFSALQEAARMAFGTEGNPSALGVVEAQEISSVASFAVCEALGLAPLGEGSAVLADGHGPVVNPSGGNLPANPGNASGFLRFINAAQQVRGRAGNAQVEPRPKSALGAGMHGFAGQGAAVMIFTADRSEVA